MAKAFLKSVAEHVYNHHKDNVDKLCIVLPNKRGALFLKKHLAQTFAKTIWLPTIISIEELINELSELTIIEEIDLICLLYESYKTCYGTKAESFESFAKWGQLILQDFNEIDRFLADPEQLYDNLKHIKEIENWSLGENNLSEYQTNYLQFMNSLGPIYKHYTSYLLSKSWAYQGLAYRQAVKNVDEAEYPNQFAKLLFCGFNALNAAEIKIIQTLKNKQQAELLWDADSYYLNNTNQEAGDFLRQNFSLFPNKEQSFIENNFSEEKTINILSVPKQIGQAQVVKQSLQALINEGVPLDKVAIVLANEKMLWPILKQIPAEVQVVNITMEYPIQYTSCYELIDQLVQLQLNYSKQNRQHKTIYFKDLLGLLRHPIFRAYAASNNLKPNWNLMINQINQRNLVFITSKNLHEIFGENLYVFELLVKNYDSTALFCKQLQLMIDQLINYFISQNQNTQLALEQEYLNILNLNFNRLSDIISKYLHFNTWPAFKQLFTQVIGSLSSPFVGEPLQGLQVMGVLETRTLDFDYLILVNVNEGILPAGKTNGSFIPNDLKRVFGLPLYSEKDAIYAYHFYRLMQRAKQITITYDSETDSLGKGEKSRFVTQLQMELKQFNSKIRIEERTVIDENYVQAVDTNIIVSKNQSTLEPIYKKAESNSEFGSLSPSSLIVFKECSLKFYFRYAAHLKVSESVEEVAEANTFGSILHKSLELIYADQIGKQLHSAMLYKKIAEVSDFVRKAYMLFFDEKNPSGKNILHEEVIKVYTKKVLQSDVDLIEDLKTKKQFLKLIDLEKEFSASLIINDKGIEKQIYVKGKIDRIDLAGNDYRIIDYKNSIKQSDKFTFTSFDELFSDVDYNKQLQLIIYAWLLYKNKFCAPENMRPCIVPLKVFSNEPTGIKGENKQDLIFTSDFLNDFEKALGSFIESIFDESTNFVQTHDTDICLYCDYNKICNIQV